MIQADNTGAIVATQSLARSLGIGVFATDIEDLSTRLADRELMARLRANMWRQRHHFTFDHHAGRLIEFFRSVIAARS
jgi:hypothetical protein